MAHKTNAVRLLDQMRISYELREYAVDPEDLAPVYELFGEKCMQAAPIAGLNDLRLYTTTQVLR